MNNNNILPDEVITSKIYILRGEKVMLDRDLAELYRVETKYLKTPGSQKSIEIS